MVSMISAIEETANKIRLNLFPRFLERVASITETVKVARRANEAKFVTSNTNRRSADRKAKKEMLFEVFLGLI